MIYQILITVLWRGSFIVLIHGNDKGEPFWILTTFPHVLPSTAKEEKGKKYSRGLLIQRVKGEGGGGTLYPPLFVWEPKVLKEVNIY